MLDILMAALLVLAAFTRLVDTTPEPVPTPPPAPPAAVEAPDLSSHPYGDLIAEHFLADDHGWAVRVMWCESRNDPDAVNASSGAAGLFQHLPQFWPDRATAAGYPDGDPHDPATNIAVAAWLYYTHGATHWACT